MPLDQKTILTAVKEAKEKSTKRKFNQSVELILKLQDIDMKAPESKIQEVVELPYAFEKPNAICVIASGELAMKGEDVSAPLAAIYLLAHGTENRVTPLALAEAARGLLRNTLFFAHDRDLVGAVFAAGCDLAQRVPVRQLEFVPDARVWEYAE